MRSIRVHYDDGRSVATNINGTEQEIREYYLGKQFNLGDGFGGDSMTTAMRVEFLDTVIIPCINAYRSRVINEALQRKPL